MAASNGDLVFIKAIDGSSKFKDKHFIGVVLKDAIKKIGHEKVVQVITDNASVMKFTIALIEGEYPKIFWTPCVVHTLNLALKLLILKMMMTVVFDCLEHLSFILF